MRGALSVAPARPWQSLLSPPVPQPAPSGTVPGTASVPWRGPECWQATPRGNASVNPSGRPRSSASHLHPKTTIQGQGLGGRHTLPTSPPGLGEHRAPVGAGTSPTERESPQRQARGGGLHGQLLLLHQTPPPTRTVPSTPPSAEGRPSEGQVPVNHKNLSFLTLP